MNFFDIDGKLIAPVELYFLPSAIILTVHPSAAPEILDQLKAIMPQTKIRQRQLNVLRIISKQAAM